MFYCFNVPGFNTLRSLSIPGEGNRGGVAVLFKNALWKHVVHTNILKDQVWFSLQIVPGLTFGALYICPSDSPFYSTQPLEKIQEKWSEGNDLLIIGDLNARLGDLSSFVDNGWGIKYHNNIDNGVNENGRKIQSLCSNLNLRPVNHAYNSLVDFQGNLTFKKKDKWISQLDWCIVSANMLQDITSFEILQNLPLVSDHAALSVIITRKCVLTDYLQECAYLLDNYSDKVPSAARVPVKYNNMDMDAFVSHLCHADDLWQSTDIFSEVSSILYKTCRAARYDRAQKGTSYDRTLNRWHSILQQKDAKSLWQAIDWKGNYLTPPSGNLQPTNEKFAHHFSTLLNPEERSEDLHIPSSGIYIPALDDDITPREVLEQINKLKSGKAAGADCIPPGIFKQLPDDWIILLTFIMNIVFYGTYPAVWCLSKLFVIYKKGLVSDTNNYRGISITDALPKLYDGILHSRLTRWYKPYPEQAGSQAGRGCEEQLLTLRLFIDISRMKKLPLYILFIDYVKAYDRVNRNKLLQMLCQKGCGDRFLKAIGNSLKNTYGLIGAEKFKYTRGVKQGSSTSCSLFTLYLDCTVEAVHTYGNDGFLNDNHILLLMDDTVLLATSRAAMQAKLELLYAKATDIDMIMHPGKSKFIVVNSDDVTPFQVGNISVAHTSNYTYLGSPISSESIIKHVENHIKDKQSQVFKYNSFVDKNYNAPYQVKQKVLQAAVNSSLLYSCESWLITNLKRVDTVVATCIKKLLDIRTQIPSDIIYAETDIAPASAEVQKRQINFFNKLFRRTDLQSYPVGKAIELAKDEKSPMGKFINNMNHEQNPTVILEQCKEAVRNRIQTATTTRMVTYKLLNSDLRKHTIYERPDIPEAYRIAFSRLRVSSHYLRIETGRWCRLARELRKCICGSIQTEEHVLLACPETETIRQQHNTLTFSNINDLMTSTDASSLARFCSRVLKKMNKNY